MSKYPKQDKEIVICTADGSVMTGMVNIAGRSISSYMQDSEPDVIIYDVRVADQSRFKTLMVTKRQIVWISVTDEIEREQYGIWQKLAFKVNTGNTITGDIDITGYDRISDYVQRYNNRFHEVFDCIIDEEPRNNLIFVSRHLTVWKEPVG